jgi:5-oxoprolinase (ATP-hydrolysing)
VGATQALEIVGEAGEGVVRVAGRLEPPLADGELCEIAFDEEAPVVAARLATGTPRGASLPPMAVRLATTRGTNALLERRGVPVALFVNEGFADLLVIGSQQREELFTLQPYRSPPLHAAVVEIAGRLDAEGREIEPLDLDGLPDAAERLLAAGVRSAAVAFLHSYRNPEHERRCAARLGELGFAYVARSSDLAPRIQIVPRAETAVVDAYLSEAVRGYLDRVEAALGEGGLEVMTSAGGLTPAKGFRPKDGLLSGPAGGVVGAAAAGSASGETALLAFDMGGTSTDVSRWAGDFEYRFEARIGGVRVLAPALAIETVAAGGGSECWFDGSGLRVGPRSAGAEPGPACYGAGGPLTLTDVNLLLGRLAPDRFGIPLAPERAEERVRELAAEVSAGSGERLEWEELLDGLLRIADERMGEAVRKVSIRRGFAPPEHTLLAFGGAGGQHACSLAELLGISTVLVPAEASLLSAVGLGAARGERFAERQILAPLAAAVAQVPTWVEELAAEARARWPDGRGEDLVLRRALASLRLEGQEATLEVEVGAGVDLATIFRERYRDRYGYSAEDRPIELESLQVVVGARAEPPPPAPRVARRRVAPERRLRAWFGGAWEEVAAFDRERLGPGDVLDGPALVFEPHGTTVVAPGWAAEVDGAGALVLRR